jgi:hypothetical protein
MQDHAAAGGKTPRAGDVFDARLLPRPGGALLHRARVAAAFLSGLASGLVPSPSVHDVVVSRRDDGTEVLRVPAGDPLAAGDMLRSVETELATLDPEEFLQVWDVR